MLVWKLVLLIAQTRLTGFDNRLTSRRYLGFAEDIRNMIPDGLRA